MTRKDYVLIAQVLRNQAFISGIDLDLLAEDFADVLALDNPRFDRERFLIASGHEANKRNTTREEVLRALSIN